MLQTAHCYKTFCVRNLRKVINKPVSNMRGQVVKIYNNAVVCTILVEVR
jgi:hypothetical protein